MFAEHSYTFSISHTLLLVVQDMQFHSLLHSLCFRTT